MKPRDAVSPLKNREIVMTELTRRNFLKLSVVSAAASLALGLVGYNDDWSDDPGILSGTTYFPQLLASGDPRPESVVLMDPDRRCGDR